MYKRQVLAQQAPEQALARMDEQYPQEKIHLFLQKEAIVAGETIQFKAYLFSGNLQSFISATLFAELLDSNKKIQGKTHLPLTDGTGSGSIITNDSLPEGIYFLRAYTRWMLNFNTAFEYIIPIRVYNPASDLRLMPRPVSWTAAAFPESGKLIAGMNNKVAVRLNPCLLYTSPSPRD